MDTGAHRSFAEKQGIQPDAFNLMLENCKVVLRKERSKRVAPGLDDKILLGWNALMNNALGKAYAATGIESYRDLAIQNMQFLETNFNINGIWYHSWKSNQAGIPAFLDDKAFNSSLYYFAGNYW